MHACSACACVYVRECVSECVYICICVYIYMCVCVCVCVHMYVCVYIYIWCTYVCVYICVCVYIYTHVCACVCVVASIHEKFGMACACVGGCIRMCHYHAYIHICICIYKRGDNVASCCHFGHLRAFMSSIHTSTSM